MRLKQLGNVSKVPQLENLYFSMAGSVFLDTAKATIWLGRDACGNNDDEWKEAMGSMGVNMHLQGLAFLHFFF